MQRNTVIVAEPKRNWLMKLLSRFFALIGFFVVVIAVLAYLAISRMSGGTEAVPGKIVATYTFDGSLGEAAGRPGLDQPLLRAAPVLHDVIAALDMAAKDTRVKAFAARIEDVQFSVAQAQELREAVLRFRKSGRSASVYSDSYGGMGAGMGEYYLASAFNEVWLQPVGIVAISGIAAEVPFLRGVLDKVGIEPEFNHKGMYKSAPESLTAKEMSPPNREMMAALIGDLSAQMMADIAAARKIAPDQLRAFSDQSPFDDTEALKIKLVDRLGYYDEMIRQAEKDGAESMDLMDYAAATAPQPDREAEAKKLIARFSRDRKPGDKTAAAPQKRIALITGAGDIVSAGGSTGFGEGGMQSEKIADAFQDAREDDSVAAVVFRIDSPGGSPSAAETIRRAVIETQKAGKPVIVSMGGYAASGGYWIATPADKIIAQPGTITGSIGVFGGKMVLSKLWEKIGVNWEGMTTGQNARMWSANKNFSPSEYAKFDSMLDHIYDAFLTRVMEGRKMTRAQAEAVAEGRVFTGKQALQNGLVDALGGVDLAVAAAKQAAKIDPAVDVPLVMFPERQTPLEMFLEMATQSASLQPSFKIGAEEIYKNLQPTDTGILKTPFFLLH